MRKMKVENWAGLISMLGSLTVLASGDAEGFFSTAAFLIAEAVFATKGHKTWGYSLGSLGLCIGDAALCFSHAVSGNSELRLAMVVLSVIWGVAALRYPIELVWKAQVADSIPAIVGTSAVVMRLVTLYAAIVGTSAVVMRLVTLYAAIACGGHVNGVLLTANVLWGTADVLLGRFGEFLKRAVRTIRRSRQRPGFAAPFGPGD